MARVRWEWVLLCMLLFVFFWFRMELATSVESLSYDSYLTVREIEHIRETGAPLKEDPLSVTGRTRVGSPFFSYFLALILFSDSIYKILPNVFMVLLLIPVYLLARSFTQSPVVSLISAALAGTAPVVFSSYLNTPASVPLSAALFLAIIFMLQDPDTYLYWIVAFILLLTFISPLAFVLVLSLLMIIVLLKIEGFGVDRRINELFFFTLILAVWFNVLVYKRALFSDGISILWQNLPAKYVALQFGSITLLHVLYALGVVAVLFGMLGSYHALFESRVKSSFSVIGAIIAVTTLLLFRVIEIPVGLLFLSLLLAVMAGHGLRITWEYLKLTKIPRVRYLVASLVVVLFVFTAIFPALSDAEQRIANAPSPEDIVAFQALRSYVSHGAVLLTTIREAAAVQYYSGHTTLTDADFLLLPNGDELVRDVDTTYTSPFVITIIGKSEKLGFTHILFSEDAARQYSRSRLRVDDSACLKATPVSSGTILYRVLCTGDTSA